MYTMQSFKQSVILLKGEISQFLKVPVYEFFSGSCLVTNQKIGCHLLISKIKVVEDKSLLSWHCVVYLHVPLISG